MEEWGRRLLRQEGTAGARTGKVDRARVVGVDLVDHVLHLDLGRVLSERAHDGHQLRGRDLPCSPKSKRQGISFPDIEARFQGPDFFLDSGGMHSAHRRHSCPERCERLMGRGSWPGRSRDGMLLTKTEKISLYSAISFSEGWRGWSADRQSMRRRARGGRAASTVFNETNERSSPSSLFLVVSALIPPPLVKINGSSHEVHR